MLGGVHLSRKVSDASGRQIIAGFGGVGPMAVSNAARKVEQVRPCACGRGPHAGRSALEQALR